jgi:hypothetical protein
MALAMESLAPLPRPHYSQEQLTVGGHHLEVLFSQDTVGDLTNQAQGSRSASNVSSAYLGYWWAKYDMWDKEVQHIAVDTDTGKLQAIKVTGDGAVPANHWTWKTSRPLLVGTRVNGTVLVRDEHNWAHKNGYFEIPATIAGLDKDTIYVSAGYSTFFNRSFHRVGPETTAAAQEAAVQGAAFDWRDFLNSLNSNGTINSSDPSSNSTTVTTEEVGLNMPIVGQPGPATQPCADTVTGLRFSNGTNAQCSDLSAYCSDQTFGDQIRAACLKTCGRCYVEQVNIDNCTDGDSADFPLLKLDGAFADCKELSHFCSHSPVRNKCKVTCSVCKLPTTPPVPPVSATPVSASNATDKKAMGAAGKQELNAPTGNTTPTTSDAGTAINATEEQKGNGNATKEPTTVNTGNNTGTAINGTAEQAGNVTPSTMINATEDQVGNATKEQATKPTSNVSADLTNESLTLKASTRTTTDLPEPYRSMIGCSRRRMMGICATRRRRII